MAPAGKEELRAQIERAFASRAHPGDEYIDSFDPRSPDDEEVIVFRGKDWREIVTADIGQWYQAGNSALAVMKPAGLAYFLPAFLTMAVEVDPADDSRAGAELFTFAESLCFYLTRPARFPHTREGQYEFVKDMPEVPGDIKEYLRNPTPEARATERAIFDRHQQILNGLSGQEKAAVTATLEYLADVFRQHGVGDETNCARKALQTTWAEFGPDC